MHPKHKGSLAELQACAWLLKAGYEVFRNVSQHGHADLIAWRPGNSPELIEVRRLVFRPAADGTTCSPIRSKARSEGVHILYAMPDTGECGFDLAELAKSAGYTLRPPPPRGTQTCTVAGCGKKHQARGFCRLHYGRYWRGLVDGPSLIPRSKTWQTDDHFPHQSENRESDNGGVPLHGQHHSVVPPESP